MPAKRTGPNKTDVRTRIDEAIHLLSELGFGDRQRNDLAALTLLAMLGLRAKSTWKEATAPLMGITPIIDFIARGFGVPYKPNTRESIRDDAVKVFESEGLLVKNPDAPDHPTNSGRTVYQIEPHALRLVRKFGSGGWNAGLQKYLAGKVQLRAEIRRLRVTRRVPVRLPNGVDVGLSPGGQNPLIKATIEEFCPRFSPGAMVLYVGDTENKFVHLEVAALAEIGVVLPRAAMIPDLIVSMPDRNWLLLIEAVTSAGPVDGKRRMELKSLFAGSTAGLVFVTAFATRTAFQRFASRIAWETEVWIADDPEHMIHFNGERFLGPYPDAMPRA